MINGPIDAFDLSLLHKACFTFKYANIYRTGALLGACRL